MIQISAQTRILVAVEPVDFRNGVDGLAGLCRALMQADPFDGTVFVFRNRRRTAIRLLTFDGQGMWIAHKRLSSGHFHWWPERAGSAAEPLEAHELQLLLWNGDPRFSRVAARWRNLQSS